MRSSAVMRRARTFASDGAAVESGSEDEDDSEDEGDASGRRGKRREKIKYVVPDSVPNDPPMLRTLLVRSDNDAALATTKTCAEALSLATETLAGGGQPPSSRAMRIIITKVETSDDVRAVFDFMAKIFQIRLAKHTDAATAPYWSERVILDLYSHMFNAKDYENAAWAAENFPILGVRPSSLTAKQVFFTLYMGPFDLLYRGYEALRERYGTASFATATMIGASLDNNQIDLAREYVDAFMESEATIPSKTFYKFCKVAVRKGDAANAKWAQEMYLQSIKHACAHRIKRANEINAQIDDGTYKGKLKQKIQIDPKLHDPKPLMPFYFITTAQMHLLHGEVEAASNALNDMPSFEHKYVHVGEDAGEGVDGSTSSASVRTRNVETECLETFSSWPSKLYVDEGFSGEPTPETLRETMKAAIAGIARDDIRSIFERVDVDSVFDALEAKPTEAAAGDAEEQPADEPEQQKED